MKIKKKISQIRRDFEAMFVCEHCGVEEKKSGYDDSHFHNNVIPDMKCTTCGKKAPEEYQPEETKYPDALTV